MTRMHAEAAAAIFSRMADRISLLIPELIEGYRSRRFTPADVIQQLLDAARACRGAKRVDHAALTR